MKKFLTYTITTKYQQERIEEKHTVEVLPCGTKVKNRNGAVWNIAPFLKHPHEFHDCYDPL